MIRPTCLHCSKPITTGDSRKKFCDHSCAASYNNSKFPKRRTVETKSPHSVAICVECGVDVLQKKKPDGSFYPRTYCPKCLGLKRISNIHQGITVDDLFENQTKGSLYNRRKNWQSANSTLRNHSRKVYMASDLPKCCKICGYNTHIEISHIKPVKDFSDDAKVIEINAISNLIAFCPNHHWEFDRGLIHIENSLIVTN